MVSRYLESTRVPLEEENVLGNADPEQLVKEGRERTVAGWYLTRREPPDQGRGGAAA